jgi:hypothetical protein
MTDGDDTQGRVPLDSDPDDRRDADVQEDLGDADVQKWLKGALRDEPPREGSVDVLAGVQKKLRERSGGKFYADVWSTAKQPPILTFLVTSAVMLAIVLITYAILAPLSSTPEKVHMEPKGVEVLPPAGK